ncbi:hypothetical protein AMS68_000767 [Peltaster fructicola]|uniref:Uncharacterized protein n=1 Tax=Peltaster fructicola TaxID=286661 RepID=A0A6H0XL73_9PEZI|nr:hypothetical protein AMS68_000767 [Peltaster fructicola]
MTTPSSSRIEDALEKLLTILVPARYEDESQTDAQRRWTRANDLARSLLNTQRESSRVEDVGLAADIIKRGLLKGQPGEISGKRELERATRFGNLYSRLLAQPILSQKWGILWFLWKAGQGGLELDGVKSPGSLHGGYGDSIARNGLERLARTDGSESPVRPVVRDHAPRARLEKEEPKEEPHQVTKPVAAPTEIAIMRDLPFTFQGLSSTTMPFADTSSLRLPSSLPIPIVSLLHTLAEPALLYKSLSAFTESSETGGLVLQSLRSSISVELRSYLSLVAQLEGQVRRAVQQLQDSSTREELGKASVTLKRLVIWTRDATLGLRLMALIVDSAKDKKGGELISMVHSFATAHGDPFVHVFAERLVHDITRPFYGMLRAWVYDGELEDPYREFFVYENDDSDEAAGRATSVWDYKYALQAPMVPSIMTAEFANKVFLIGKSLNFIRYSCNDSAWVETYSRTNSHTLSYGDTADLSSSIDTAYATVMARLLSLMETKFALFTHLSALKNYLLLGQGDFIALLMESLASNLDRPANSQYRHTLTAQLEHAIRNSNAQHDNADVLRRLDARMLELSHGEIGWDVFTLEYRIDSPLDVIVTPWASKQYLKVFNFLWRVKRVEFALGTTWRRCMTGARGVLSAVGEKLGQEWKLTRGAMAEMVHFVNQLQWYILFEVIEAGWEGLQRTIRKPGATLDTLIEAHTTYLRSITRKGLLGGGASDFTSQLHELLKLMLAYRDAVDSLYSISVADFTRKQERAAKIETRTKAGNWGADVDDSLASSTMRGQAEDSPIPPLLNLTSRQGGDQNILEHLRSRLQMLRGDFKARINMLLGDLRDQPDTDMRFLGVVMNFNDAYTPVRRRRTTKNDKDKGVAKEGGLKLA